jgi:hypothetical protein
MNKKTAILSGVLVMLAVVASIGVIANQTMVKKGVSAPLEGRNDYVEMSKDDLNKLEQELKATEAESATPETAEEGEEAEPAQ